MSTRRRRIPALEERPLFDEETAEHLESLFKVLANSTRIRMVQALHAAGELSVGEIAGRVGMSQQAVSNQLQRLVDRRIVRPRREGNRILYRIIDPCVPALLDHGVCFVEQVALEDGGEELRAFVDATRGLTASPRPRVRKRSGSA